MAETRRRYHPTGQWTARVEWNDEQAPARTPTSGVWWAINCWVTGVLSMHGQYVKQITIEPAKPGETESRQAPPRRRRARP